MQATMLYGARNVQFEDRPEPTIVALVRPGPLRVTIRRAGD